MSKAMCHVHDHIFEPYCICLIFRNPMAICFHFPNASLSHRQVLDAAKRKLQFVKDGCVENIQVSSNSSLSSLNSKSAKL